jgi:hypothetical protein
MVYGENLYGKRAGVNCEFLSTG